MVFTGRHAEHNGPPGVRLLTGRTRPQPAQVSRLAGSVTRQCGHSGRPCSSRIATCWTDPHRAHGWKPDLATQLRQHHWPPIRRFRCSIRPQRGAGGMNDRLRACVAKPVDQPQHRGNRRLRADSCEEGGPVLQDPGQRLPLPGPRHRRPHGRSHHLGAQRRVSAGDDLDDQTDRIAASSGRALGAPGLPVPVTAVDTPDLPAGRARFPDRPQTPQYQSSPRRWKVRSCLPQSARAGAAMAAAPTLRKPMSRSATARGAETARRRALPGCPAGPARDGGAWRGRPRFLVPPS